EIAVEPDFDAAARELRQVALRYCTRLLAIGKNSDCNATAPGIDQRLRDFPVRKRIRVDEDFGLRPIDGGDDEVVDGVAGSERELYRTRRRIAAWTGDVRGRDGRDRERRRHGDRQRHHERSPDSAAAVHRLRSSTAAKKPSQP